MRHWQLQLRAGLFGRTQASVKLVPAHSLIMEAPEAG
jgi:hypothetical protein